MNDIIEKQEFSTLSSFLIRSLFLGSTVFGVLHIAQNDGWLSMILSFIISFIPLLIYYLLFTHDSKLNIVKLTNKYLGWFGKIINILITIFILFQAALILWNLTNFISSQFLYQTPLLAIGIAFMIGVVYMISKGLKTVGRCGIILFIINIILFLLALFSLIFKVEVNQLLPFAQFGIIPIFKGSLISISYNVLPLFVLLIIPKDNVENNKKLISSFLKIYIATFICIFFVIFVCITILGVEVSNLYQYPEYHILKTINVANFFQRVESILSIQWIFDCIMSLVLYIYYIKTAIHDTFSLKKDSKIWIYIIALLIIILSRNIFSNNTQAEIFATYVFPYFCIGFLFVIPLIILIIAKLRKNKT